MKEEKFPHTRKSLHWWRQQGGRVGEGSVGEESSEAQRRAQQRGAEGKAQTLSHRGLVLTSTQKPERLLCSSTRAGGDWELRLGHRRSYPRETTGVGCVNTA